MNLKKLVSATTLGLGLVIAAGSAQSALYSFEDDDIDFILRNVGGTLTQVTSGSLQVGDIFVSVLEVPIATLDGSSVIPAGMELTGVAAVQLQSCGSGTTTGTACNPASGTQYVFNAYSGGLNSILALGTDPDANVGAAGDATGGAAIALFLNSTSDFNLDLNRTTNPATNCISLADCLSAASDGTLFQLDGFRGDPDEFWIASASTGGSSIIGPVGPCIPPTPGVPGSGSPGVRCANNNLLVASYNAELSNFQNALGPIGFIDIASGLQCPAVGYVADGCVQFSVSGTITGGQGLVNGAVAHSDFDAQKYSLQVPEPGPLALLALGLAAAGFSRRKSK